MRNLIIVATLAMTAIMFAMGYAVSFVVTAIAMSLDLPGPYAASPIAWVWFGLSLLMLFGVSFAFCQWFARKVEKRILTESTFE